MSRVGLAMLGCVVAGCAEVPVAPTASTTPAAAIAAAAPSSAAPAAARTDSDNAFVAARHQHALQLRAAGDLARAEAELHVLTLLAPDVAVYRDERSALRQEIARVRDEQLRAGQTSLRNGDAQRAEAAFLRVLAADPDHVEAARALREIDRRRIARVQATASARAGGQASTGQPTRSAPRETTAGAAPAPAAAAAYDLEQRIELFSAGDISGGLRELRAYVDANPRDRDGRARIGTAVFERARDVEARDREQALSLFETAVALRGDTPAAWNGRIVSLRRTLSNDYYDRGVRTMRTDLPAAIKLLEASVRFDGSNARAAVRLAEARSAQVKLNAIAPAGASNAN